MRALDRIISTAWEFGRRATSWAPSQTSWIHIILGADAVWGPKLCSLQKGVVTHGVSHRVGTILGSISKYHLSHTYPCLVNMSVLWEKTSRTECLMRRGAHIHVDVTVCGFPFIALARPRNWFWYWVSVFPSSFIFTILWQFLINIWVWIQRFSGSQEMVQVLTRPDFFLILHYLGIWKCSRTLVFAMTFTEQLSLPTDKRWGLVSCKEAGSALAIGKHCDTLNVSIGSVWF